MRISDWSSDVCSSDLLGLALAGATLLRHGRLHGEPVDEVVHRVAGVALDPAERHVAPIQHELDERLPQVAVGDGLALRVLPAPLHPALVPAIPAAVHDEGENGRASCRESVCKYV